MNHHLERREGLRSSRVNDADPGAIPATAIQACALAGERRPGTFALDDPPSANHQEKTPCSSRPIKFSTSRAPGSVREYAKGVRWPRAFLGLVSQVTAPATSPSNNSTACSNTVETRSRRSDSSGANTPAVLRRARVLSGIPRTDAIRATDRPLRAARDSRALKGNPRSICRTNRSVRVAVKPRLAPRVLKRTLRPWEACDSPRVITPRLSSLIP